MATETKLNSVQVAQIFWLQGTVTFPLTDHLQELDSPCSPSGTGVTSWACAWEEQCSGSTSSSPHSVMTQGIYASLCTTQNTQANEASQLTMTELRFNLKLTWKSLLKADITRGSACMCLDFKLQSVYIVHLKIHFYFVSMCMWGGDPGREGEAGKRVLHPMGLELQWLWAVGLRCLKLNLIFL